MSRHQGDKSTDEAKESARSKLTGQVEAFLSGGGKIEQVPGGKTGMTKYLKKLETAKETSEKAKSPNSVS